MRVWLLASVLLFAGLPPAQKYFSDARKITVSEPGSQSYVIVDQSLWERSRPDLADIRLYSASGEEVPYAIREQRASSITEEKAAVVLQLGSTAGQTTFVLDLGGLSEYDRVTLALDAHDFVATAVVEGMEQLKGAPTTRLGSFTLFDFSKEKLGRNFVVKLPRSAFAYLKVTLSQPLRPQQVLGATVADVQEKRASWTPIAVKVASEQQGRITVMRWQQPSHLPLERLEFSGGDVNFRRPVRVKDAQGNLVAGGEITRVRLVRGGKTIEKEETSVAVPSARSERFTVEIENGDDPPLRVTVQPFSVERRICFDPRGQSSLQMFYGDPQVGAPVYDYAKLFQEDPKARAARMEAPEHNASFVGRADDRPWTERHPSVMWIALLAAVLGLAVFALRGLRA